MDKLLCGRRMLVVEDEMLILMTIEDVLADLGCECVTATGASDKAIALIDEQVFDAALLDMNLNGGSSRTVADALAAQGVPFVFATGNRGKCGMITATAPFFENLLSIVNWSRF